MRICYVFASRTRPKKFFAALDNIAAFSESKDYFVLAKLDDDDPTADAYKEQVELYSEVTVKWGLSKSKVHAINRDCEYLPPCDIIVVFSDDMVWETYGFDTQIRNAFEQHFPNLDGVVHFPDSHAAERTMTLTIMGINLYKQLGYLYFPDYESVYPDNDLTEMTRLMGKYVFINKRIFDHYHPIWNMTAWDDQYRKNEAQEYYQKDHQTYLKRKANNFGL